MGKRKNVVLPPSLPAVAEDDELVISDEDIEDLVKDPKRVRFLVGMDTESIDRHVSRVAADQENDRLESSYENRRKKKADLLNAWENDEPRTEVIDALPIKTLEGELRYRTAKDLGLESSSRGDEAASKDNEEKTVLRITKAAERRKAKKSREAVSKKPSEEGVASIGGLHSEVLANVEKELSAQELCTRKKQSLAEAGTKLLENPESNIKMLKDLLQTCKDSDNKVVKLGLLSLLVIFKDIIPGYRIRLPTEKEFQMKVSKDVRRTRFFESTLLRSYKAYLISLIDLEKKPAFQHVAVRCLCGLLEAVPHFNFRESLLTSIVNNISSSDDVVRNLCCEAIRSLFVNEGKHGGEATLEAVQLLTKHVKMHECLLHPDSIEVFLSLKFDEDLAKSEFVENDEVRTKESRHLKSGDPKNSTGFDRKRVKQELVAKTREEVNADFKAASFVPDIKDRARVQSDTLSAIFETYFRILKHSMGSLSSNIPSAGGLGPRPLLAPCLNGLGKFSHLIDLDFMFDLMRCLKTLAGYRDHYITSSVECQLSVTERLQCCIVAFKVMRNNLDALNIDLNDYFVQLYNILLEYRPDRDKGIVLAEALKTMLWEVKQHDMQRAAAFIKRLATFSLCFSSSEAMAALTSLKNLLQKNSKCRSLLENDIGGGSLSGLVTKYQPDSTDPNLSGALSSVLWELSLLAKHYKTSLSSTASSCTSMVNTNGASARNQVFLLTASPLEAFKECSLDRERFVPSGKAAAFGRSRKPSRGLAVSDAGLLGSLGVSNDDEIIRKLEDHFTVLWEVAENERLRIDLDNTASQLNLYKEFKGLKKKKDASLP